MQDKQPNFPKSSNTALGRNRPEHTPPEKSVNPIFDNFFLKPFMKINKRQSSVLANNQPGHQIIQPQRNKLPNTIPEVMELLSSFGRRTVAEKDSKFSSNTKKDAKQFKKVDYSSPRNVSNLEDKYKGPEKLSHQITLPLLLSQLMNSFRDISRSSQKLEKGFLNLPNFFAKVRREDSETKSPAKKNLSQENGPVNRRRSFLFNLPDLISGFSSKPSASKLSNKSGGLFKDRLPSFKSPGFSQKTDRNGISNQEPPATVYKKSTDEFLGSAPDLKSQTFPSSETINKGNPYFRSLLQQRVNTDPIEKYSPRTTQNQNFAKKSDQTNTATSRRLDKPPIIIYQGKAPPVHVFEKSQAR